MTKIKGIFLVFFAALIAVAIWFSSREKSPDGTAQVTISSTPQTTVLKGVITSEKENFFKDERVKAVFIKNGFDVQVTRMTSDKIVGANNAQELSGYSDFVFPSSVSVSEKVKTNFKSSQAYNIFYSPMVIATWKPIVKILTDNGIIQKTGKYETFNMNSYLSLVDKGTRWNELKQSEEYPVNKLVLVSTSDARYSGSAKMYLALTSYILNNGNVVGTDEELNKVLPILKKIVQAQGNRESSSSNMTSDYVSIGRGKVPMMFTYESEFLSISQQNPALVKKGAVFVYPSPTVYSKHVLIVINPKAQAIVELMKKNVELQKLASQHGFRIEGDSSIVQHAKSIGVDIPDVVVDVIDPPNYDILDKMSESVETK